MISADQFAQAVQTLWLAQIVATVAFLWAASSLPLLTAFLLSRWPAYRTWKRKRNRAERMEDAEYRRINSERLARVRQHSIWLTSYPSPLRLCAGCAAESAVTCVCRGRW